MLRPPEQPGPSKALDSRHWTRAVPYAGVVLAVTVITATGKAAEPVFDLVTIALLYLLPVLISAVRWGLWPSLVASFLGILSFDFFFVPPLMSMTVADVRYLLSFAIFLVVALVTGTLAAKLRAQAEAAGQRERRTAALYAITHRMVAQGDLQGVLKTFVDTVARTVKGEVAVFLPVGPDHRLEIAASSTNAPFAVSAEESTDIRRVFNHEREAGPAGKRLFVPVSDAERTLAVLALPSAPGIRLSQDVREDLAALTNILALAITRMQLAEEAEQAKWLAESEKLHAALLNAVSHDLRTPLSAITGAVTGLLSEGERYDEQARRNLLLSIKAGALRMNRFITNLLDMARLESGILKLNRELCDVEDIIGVALKEVEEILPEHRVAVSVPDDLSPVAVDFGLIEQVLINLLENSAKYSPADARIRVAAAEVEGDLRITIEDSAVLIPEAERQHVFDKFYRLRSARHVAGSGLGLSICKGIVEAHGGRIWVAPGEHGGNGFAFALPLPKERPGVHDGRIEEN